MDELVADLSSALVRTNDPPSAHSDTTIGTRESPSGTPVRKTPRNRKRRGKRRRSDYPPSREIPNISAESNDSVEEALMDYIENIKCQSDSDPEDETSFTKRLLKVQLHGRDNLDPFPVPDKEKGESDSVSEPLVGLTKRRKKRKRKHKRVSASQALNDRDSPLTMVNLKALSRTRKRKVCGKSAIGSEIHNSLRRRDEEGSLADIENGLSSGCGEPMETNTSSNHFYKLPSRLYRASTSKTHITKDRNIPHSSSWLRYEDRDEKMTIDHLRADLSSSGESDLEGLFTNDEGCMGDDEKEESSFECDVKISPWWDEKTASDIEEEKFQNIVNGVMDGYRRPFVSIVEGKGGSGPQGRLKKNQNTYGQYVTMSDINRNIAVFLQNDKWTELAICPSNKMEAAQVYQWASLYSLQCLSDPAHRGRVLLRKTSHLSPPRPHSRPGAESKRRRKMPPQLDSSLTTVGGEADPIPPSNIGNQMLRVMGWTPGTGLGSERNGIKDPVLAYLRPKGLGLGHPWQS